MNKEQEILNKYVKTIELYNKGEYTTFFKIGVQNFKLAGASGVGAKEHCEFIGQMFAKSLVAFLENENKLD